MRDLAIDRELAVRIDAVPGFDLASLLVHAHTSALRAGAAHADGSHEVVARYRAQTRRLLDQAQALIARDVKGQR